MVGTDLGASVFRKDTRSLAKALGPVRVGNHRKRPSPPPQQFSYIDIIVPASGGNVIGIHSPGGASFPHMHLK